MFVLMIYDVGEQRVNKVLKLGRKYLNWVQNSVLEGELTPAIFKRLKLEVIQEIEQEHDSVIFYSWRSELCINRETLGKEKSAIDIMV